ncbi:hypothetical protein PVAP13_9NG127273 [Panicum virgatum]|uniref:Secreted protein n=1 Tax=Panicum virgatum TaxID=38727 RepID=A0A8T0MH32_PANVG|nr:hypothetical protein PVAP13_9NG127273 [Panicum virgatum]
MAAMVLLAVLRICSVPDGMNSCLPLPASQQVVRRHTPIIFCATRMDVVTGKCLLLRDVRRHQAKKIGYAEVESCLC